MPLGFLNRAKLPPEYKDLPEEKIIEIFNKHKDLETELTAAKGEAKTASDKATKLEKEFNEFKKTAGAGGGNGGGGNVGGNGGGGANGEGGAGRREDSGRRQQDEGEVLGPEHWLTDPVAATRRVTNEALTPLTAVALHSGMIAAQMQAQNMIRDAEGEDGHVNRKLWKKYSAEVQKIVEQEPPERRIFPQVWINAFTYVKGTHLNDVVKEAQTAGDMFFAETPSGGGGGGGRNRGGEDGDITLTAEEKAVAKKMGVSEKNYLEQKKKMTFTPVV